MAEVLTLVTAVVVLATAVATWRARQQVRQMQDRVEKTQTQVQEVHVMVNSQREAMAARLDQLVEALRASGTAVPPPPAPGHEVD